MKKINIAIDGPSAAGKGTIADNISARLGYIHLDTGAMYRCVALKCKNLGIDVRDQESVMEMLKDTKITQDAKGNSYLDDVDVSGLIRTDEISMMASDVSTHPLVRENLVERQQKLAEDKGYVLEGRDIGSVVLPNAELKIFLTASVEARVMRTYLQNKEKGLECDYDQLYKEIEERDYQDTHRAASPLVQAEDAILLDTSDLSIDEVTEKVLSLVRERGCE